jgi:hypothetical protein
MNTDDKIALLPPDIHKEILHYLDIRMIGRVAQLSTYWQKLTSLTAWVTSSEKARRMRILALRQYNVVEELLKYAGPENLTNLIECPNITFDIIARFPKIRWYWPLMTINPNITLEMLLELINKCEIPASTKFLIDNSSAVTRDELIGCGLGVKMCTRVITINDIHLLNYDDDDMVTFQMLGNITEDDILNCKEIEWNYDLFVLNINLSVEFLYNYRERTRRLLPINERFTHREVHRFCTDSTYGPKYEQQLVAAMSDGSLIPDPDMVFACSIFLSYATLLKYPQLCNWNSICLRRNIPFNVMIEYFDQSRRWFTYNQIIDLPDDFTVEHPWLQYVKMYHDNELTLDVVLANPHVSWSWRRLAQCRTIAICDLLDKAPMSDELMLGISERPDLTINIVVKYSNLSWCWSRVYHTLVYTQVHA